jgi:signal transduction histidine kinase
MARILIVEDDLIPANSLKAELNGFGYEVTAIADTGEIAIASAKEQPPNLAIVDIRLRGAMDGVEAAHEIQKICDCPIVFLTAFADPDTLNRASLVIPYGFLTKPARRDDIRTTVAIALTKYDAKLQQISIITEEKEQSELKNHFLDIIYHDIRTPLSTLMLAANRLNSGQAPDNLAKMVLRATTQIGQLLNEASNFQKGEFDSLSCEASTISISEFCIGMIQEVLAVTKNKCPIALINNYGDREVKLYRNLIWHILSNLLINAVKYSAPDSEVELIISFTTESFLLQISDLGIGIPQDSLPSIFLPRHRGSNVEGIEGDGLGLFSVKKSVELHGGKIEVVSELGKGTTFKVMLPLIA